VLADEGPTRHASIFATRAEAAVHLYVRLHRVIARNGDVTWPGRASATAEQSEPVISEGAVDVLASPFPSLASSPVAVPWMAAPAFSAPRWAGCLADSPAAGV
jgi:hypothetical protein